MKQTSTSEKNNNEIYVTISTNKHPKEYLVKTCLKIKYDSDKIVITPGYSKSYSKNMFCHSICPEKIKCKKKTWDNTCFRNKDSEVDSSHAVQPHITRHNKFFHITAYKEGTRVEKTHPLASYCEYDRTPLSHLSDYEVISCFRISSYSIFNDLLKDYLKK